MRLARSFPKISRFGDFEHGSPGPFQALQGTPTRENGLPRYKWEHGRIPTQIWKHELFTCGPVPGLILTRRPNGAPPPPLRRLRASVAREGPQQEALAEPLQGVAEAAQGRVLPGPHWLSKPRKPLVKIHIGGANRWFIRPKKIGVIGYDPWPAVSSMPESAEEENKEGVDTHHPK